MQAVIRRAASARKQASRKAVRLAKKQERADRKENERILKEYNKVQRDYTKTAKQNRYEDWLKGPLAPKRDSGLDTTLYGAVDSRLVHPPNIPKAERRRFILFAEGDRVCVMKGREQGKIGEITKVDEESETVMIKALNMTDVVVPEFAKFSLGFKQDIFTQTMPIPIRDIRHVIALEDNEITQDYIVQHAYGSGPYLDRGPNSKLPKYTRYVSGLDLEIPWPTENIPEAQDGAWDTVRIEVETPTWIPSLDRSPFPPTVIDELRSKYSRFRTRHDPEYVIAKKMEDYKKQFLESRTLLTPLGEWKLEQQKAAENRRKSELDEDGNRIMSKSTEQFIENFMRNRPVKEAQKTKTA